jgi:hypothetical protein
MLVNDGILKRIFILACLGFPAMMMGMNEHTEKIQLEVKTKQDGSKSYWHNGKLITEKRYHILHQLKNNVIGQVNQTPNPPVPPHQHKHVVNKLSVVKRSSQDDSALHNGKNIQKKHDKSITENARIEGETYPIISQKNLIDLKTGISIILGATLVGLAVDSCEKRFVWNMCQCCWRYAKRGYNNVCARLRTVFVKTKK